MRRRQQILLLLLLGSLLLWLTRSLWLTPVLEQLPLFQDSSGLLQTVEVAVALLGLVSIGALAYLLWLDHWQQTQEQRWAAEALKRTSSQEIRERLGRGWQVNWIDRKAVDAEELRTCSRLIITGRDSLGTTREAVELVRRAEAANLVPEDSVFIPGRCLLLLSEERLHGILAELLAPHQRVVLFLDNLPLHFYGLGLKRLDEVLVALQACETSCVIATASPDQITKAHKAWLRLAQFREVALPDLTADQAGRLVDSATGVFGIQIGDEARGELISCGDGTPGLVVSGLQCLRVQGVRHVDFGTARQLVRDGLSDCWTEAKRSVEGERAATAPLLDSLAAFEAIGARADVPLVLQYAAQLWRQGSYGHCPPYPMPALRGALNHLAADIDFVSVRESVIFPSVAVGRDLPEEVAERQLGAFLEGHRRNLQRPGLRLFNRNADLQAFALGELGQRSKCSSSIST